MAGSPRQIPLAPRRRNRRGVALLMTLIVVMLYTIIAYHYIYVTTTYSKIVNNKRDEVVSDWAARGLIFRGRAQLKLDKEFSYDSLNEPWAQAITISGGKDYPEGMKDVKVEVWDEQGRFNILLLQNEDSDDVQKQSKEIFERLIGILRREDERLQFGDGRSSGRSVRRGSDVTASKIYDGVRRYLQAREVDEGDSASFDAEAGSRIMKKQSPYSLLTISELLSAEDMTPEILYGPRSQFIQRPSEDEEDDYQIESREYDPLSGEYLNEYESEVQTANDQRVMDDIGRSTSEEPFGMADYITLWGDGRVNINTASREVILALSEHLSWEMVEDILRARDESYDRVKTVEEGNEVQAGTAPVDDFLPEGEEAANPEEDTRAFRLADIGDALSFYNRIYSQLSDQSGNSFEAVSSPEELTEDWRNAFEDMFPFLTVRSRFYGVRATAKVDRMRKTYLAVFRRDRVGGSSGGTEATNRDSTIENRALAQPRDDTSSTGDYASGGLPPEPGIRLSLIFQDEEE